MLVCSDPFTFADFVCFLLFGCLIRNTNVFVRWADSTTSSIDFRPLSLLPMRFDGHARASMNAGQVLKHHFRLKTVFFNAGEDGRTDRLSFYSRDRWERRKLRRRQQQHHRIGRCLFFCSKDILNSSLQQPGVDGTTLLG